MPIATKSGRPEAAGAPLAQERRLRILVLTPKPKDISPGQRFRVEQWAPYLAANHAIDLDFLPFESPQLTRVLYQRGRVAAKAFWILRDFLRRVRALLIARQYDGVLIYREAALIGPAIYERLLSWLGVPLFFDFDDAIWIGQKSPINGWFSKLHFWSKTATTCRVSSGVTVGNAFLADYARRYNPNVDIVPTSIDLDSYRLLPEAAEDAPFTVCWTGSITTLPLLEWARPALERLARQRPLRVKVICSIPPETPIAGAENIFIPWTAEREPDDVAACHVGIMPLPATSYMEGKCACKALQFMATGRPVILSPVGVNRDLIVHGENGFLADSEDEWVDCLTRLAESPALRGTLGQAGRLTVERNYSAAGAAARLARHFERGVQRHAVRERIPA